MPEIHYTDAILTVIFAGALLFAGWSARAIIKMDKSLAVINERLKTLMRALLVHEDIQSQLATRRKVQ